MKRFKIRYAYLFLAFILSVFIVTGCNSKGETGHWLALGTLDTTRPTVTFTDPVTVVAPGVPTSGVPINKKIAATFSEEMDRSTITNLTFTLMQGATAVSGTVAYSGVTAVFTPASPLAYSTAYTATITTGATDLAGNQLAGNQAPWPAASNYAWSFTTGLAPDTAPPTVTFTDPATVVAPGVPTSGVAINKKISATFSEVMDPLTITTTTFTLMQGATAVSGTVTYSGVTAVFTPASLLAYSTTYTATITTGATDLAGNQLSGNQAPWPTASNYVWSFTTGSAPDTTPPTVTFTVPGNDATGVAINTKPTATFSEAMDPLTITTTTFTLKQGATVITGNVIYSGVTAVFTPLSPLVYNTAYTATITTGAEDLAGNQLSGNQASWPAASNYVWSFTTGTAPDTTPPTVILTAPVNAATGVAINTKPTATFSEAMDPLTITNLTFNLKQGVTVIAGSVLYSGVTAVFTPLSPLAYNTTYTATVTFDALDLAGNRLVVPTVLPKPNPWTFTTVDTLPPPLPPPPPPAPASCLGPGPVDMGAAASFGVLSGPAGGATLTVTNPTSVTGDTGAASYIPAIGVSTLVGTKYTGVDAPYVAAKAALVTAIGCASTRACSPGLAFNFPGAHDFGGDTLDPGVYCVTGGMSVGSNLTISNPGVYIFRSTGALTSSNNVNVAFGGTANAGNTSLFWVPTGAASLGTGNNFLGTIMPDADAAITLGATTTLLGGRVLSTSDVTLDTNTIAIP